VSIGLRDGQAQFRLSPCQAVGDIIERPATCDAFSAQQDMRVRWRREVALSVACGPLPERKSTTFG
jgi:hypothetical protein